MATTNLIIKTLGDITIENGNGIPSHIASKGSTYINLDTNIYYRNNDGSSGWDENISIDTSEKSKLLGIEIGAEVNINVDWNSTSGNALILNKPTDITDLSTHLATELNDITSTGSGIIITSGERIDLNNNTTHKNSSTGNPHSVTKTEIGLSNVDNVQQIPLSLKGTNSGVAELDGGGKVPTSQLPDSVLGQMEYKGTWNATTNSPTLGNSGFGGISGDYYVVSVAGSTFVDGITDWEIGDWIVNNGTTWDKIDNTDKVSSVNSQTGVVVLDADDISDSATTNKFTTTGDISKLSGIEAGAEVNVNADWNAISGDAFILNKPTDITDLTLHNVTELSDMSSAGSGEIITTTERNGLHNILTLAVDITTTDTITLNNQEVTVNLASSSGDGAMSKEDKIKLDGLESGAAYAEYFMQGNSTLTTIVSQNVPVKISGTTTIGDELNFTATSTNRTTYNGAVEVRVRVNAVTSAQKATGGSANDYTFYFAKNGTVISKSATLWQLSNNTTGSITFQCLTTVTTNDYLEAWVENNDGTADLTVSGLNVNIIRA